MPSALDLYNIPVEKLNTYSTYLAIEKVSPHKYNLFQKTGWQEDAGEGEVILN
jgi:hypothetical protein